MSARFRLLATTAGLVLASTALAACGSTANSSTAPAAVPKATHQGVSAVFNEIYDGDFDANNANAPYGKFDVMYVAFGHIDPTTLKFGFEQKVGVAAEQQRLTTLMGNTQAQRAAGKLKIVMSLGWGSQEVGANGKPLIEQNPDLTAQSIADFVSAQGLDGFDIDYENPTFSSNTAFQTVAKAVRAKLGTGKLMTITPATTRSLDTTTLNTYYDYVNVQSYVSASGGPCNTDMLIPVTSFTSSPLKVMPQKVTAGQDTDNGCPISKAIDAYNQNNLGGVFAWQLRPNFVTTASAMYSATH